MKKLFILDTNVAMYDPTCIYNFDDNDIVLPIIIFQELDKYKKGKDEINHNTRTFIRTVEGLLKKSNKRATVSLGKGKGSLYVKLKDFNLTDASSKIPLFSNHESEINDNKILALAINLKKKYSRFEVVLVTNDINLRLKARVLGIATTEYSISDVNTNYQGYRIIDDVETDLINFMYGSPTSIVDVTLPIKDPITNEYFILKNNKQSLICRYIKNNTYKLISERSVAGITPRNLEQRLAVDALTDPDIPLVTLTGTSGSGKTLLSLAAAVDQKRHYLQIYLSKPTIPIGSDIGFLPGTLEEKMKPYLESYMDNLEVIKASYNKDKIIDKMLTEKKVQIAPITYIRGRSLPRIFFIIDEVQSTTPHEIKSIVTRAGEGTKIVLMGDLGQIDSPYLDARSNGLAHVMNKMKGCSMYAHINLIKGERSKLAELASNIL